MRFSLQQNKEILLVLLRFSLHQQNKKTVLLLLRFSLQQDKDIVR